MVFTKEPVSSNANFFKCLTNCDDCSIFYLMSFNFILKRLLLHRLIQINYILITCHSTFLQLCSLPYQHSLSFFVFFYTHFSFLNYQLWSTIAQKQQLKEPKLFHLTLQQVASRPHLQEYRFFSFLFCSFQCFESQHVPNYSSFSLQLKYFFSGQWRWHTITAQRE